MAKKKSPDTWWGDFEIPRSGSIGWAIGSLALTLASQDNEWILNYRYEPGDSDHQEHPTIAAADLELPVPIETERFVGSGQRKVRIMPALADRSVVSRPEVPFKLLPLESAEIYVGTPVWLRIELPESGVSIWENPVNRPSDTWFGASTREGEICYATRTKARLREVDVPVNQLRAITRVVLSNHGEDAMLLERINLPVTLLSLYYQPGGNIWTNEVTLERKADGDLAELQIKPGPPAAKSSALELCQAREEGGKQILRSLSSILG